jgi:hypothetical protein
MLSEYLRTSTLPIFRNGSYANTEFADINERLRPVTLAQSEKMIDIAAIFTEGFTCFDIESPRLR